MSDNKTADEISGGEAKSEHQMTTSRIDDTLVLDMNGLTLQATGKFSSAKQNSGIFASLTKLASQLEGHESATSTPVISIDLDDSSTVLVKEYDGHTVAVRKVTVDQQPDQVPPTTEASSTTE